MEWENESGAEEDIPKVPSPDHTPVSKSVKFRSPEVEIHLYRRGRGPIDVFRSKLGGWDQNQLEVQDILDKYELKSIFAFNPASGRGVAIRFNSKNGRSFLPYNDGAVVHIDGEPKDSMVMPVTKILVGIAFITGVILVIYKEKPEWLRATGFTGVNFPPWILACAVVAFTRLRKRTKDVLKKCGF